MDEGLSIRYDSIGDILCVDKVIPYAEQESTELACGVVARLNRVTRGVENLEILFFKERLERGEEMNLPVLAHLQVVEAV